MEPDNLDALYRRYMNDVYRYLLALSGSRQEAEDLVQETFYRAYLYLEHWDGDKVKPWLLRVAYNAFIDGRRKSRRSEPHAGEYFERMTDGDTPERRYLRRQRFEAIARAAEELPREQRQAWLLHYHSRLSYRDAAEAMGIGLSHYKILLFRARRRLRCADEGGERDERGV